MMITGDAPVTVDMVATVAILLGRSAPICGMRLSAGIVGLLR